MQTPETHRYQMLKRILTTTSLYVVAGLFLACVDLPRVFAQETANTEEASARKFDEYGRVGGCDHTARLDNFAIQLQSAPTSEGYVIYYGPEDNGSGARKVVLEIIQDYLVNSRGLLPNRIKTVYGGRNNVLTEPKIELWIAPQTAPPPEPQTYKTNIEAFKGLFAEHEAWDEVPITSRWGEEGTGPPVGNVTEAAFADMLRQQGQAMPYIVGYNGPDAVPGAWRRVAQREIEDLKRHGVEPGRFKIIYGGDSKNTKVQLWILPADAQPPVKDAGPELPSQRILEIGTFGDYELGDAEDQRAVLNRLVEVLRESPTLRACLIFRFAIVAPEEETSEADETSVSSVTPFETEAPAPNDIPEVQPADLAILIEKWRSELAGKHKIGEDRFIVLFATAREYEGNGLEVWSSRPTAS